MLNLSKGHDYFISNVVEVALTIEYLIQIYWIFLITQEECDGWFHLYLYKNTFLSDVYTI